MNKEILTEHTFESTIEANPISEVVKGKIKVK
jgi:hypothetical protein